jgi:hypothetical protein
LVELSLSLGENEMRKAFYVLCLCFVLSCTVKAEPRKVVQRGGEIKLEIAFKANLQVQNVFLIWQTYESIGPSQTGMATAFGCAADVVSTAKGVQLSCKVPLNAADGHYNLTSVSVETSEQKRKYGFQQDFPAEIELDIKGGNRSPVPNIKAIHLD